MRKLILFLAFVFMGMQLLHAQDREITGTITGADDGLPIPGVQILVKGTTLGTVSDLSGNYSLRVPTSATTLIYQFVGMKSQEVVIGNQTVISIIMESAITDIEGVVVTAIGIKRESKALGYAVQSVESEAISRSGNTNVLNSLSGRVAGVQVTNSSGAAGASTFVTIRGNASITGNNQPLFIIDGVPVDNSQLTGGDPRNGSNNLLFGVALSNRMVDINPEDIESINILKGGAATALYGIRAGNGAVVITTKKGSAVAGKKTSISFNSSVAFDMISQMPEMQNKYAQGLSGNLSASTLNWGPRLDSMRFDGGTNLYYPQGNIVPQNHPDAKSNLTVGPYDNIDNFFQTGVTLNNTLSLAGGSDNSTYYLSVGNSSATGVVPNNTFNRTSLTLAGETKLSKKFVSDARIGYTNSGGIRIQQGSNTSGVMLAIARMPANFDITGGSNDPVNDEASYLLPDGRQRNAYNGGGYDNPFWTVNQNQFRDKVHRVQGHAALTYITNDWLNFTYRIGSDLYSDIRNQFFARGSRTAPNGRVFEEQHFVRNLTSDLMMTINRNLTEDINFTGIFGNSMYQFDWQRLYTQGDNLFVSDFYNISNASSTYSNEYKEKKRTAAFYGDLGFSYRSMIFLNITGRNEWSTTLPEGENSFFYPSFSGSFVFTELPGLQNNRVLPFGKVRASYAMIANDAFVYATLPTFASASWGDGWTDGISFPGWGTAGYSMSITLPNNTLTPEKLKSFEVGADLRFIQNRVGLDVTYYINTNEDLILSVPIAKSSGYYFANMNAASMENKGWEVTLLGTPVKTPDFNWDIAVNFTKNTNEVLELAEGVDNVFLAGFVGAQARAVVGESYGSIYGDYWEKHSNGERLIIDDPDDPYYGFPIMAEGETNLGNVLPDWTMGINNMFKFKDLYLSFLFDIKQGGVMWNGTKGAMYYFGTHKDTEAREPGDTYVFEGVKSDGTPNDISVVRDQNWYVFGEGSGFTGPTEEFIEETDWVRLREVTLGYSFKKLIGQSVFNDVELYFTGRNLWLSTPYTGVDPETSLIGAQNGQGLEYFNMPGTKTFMVGLRVTL